MSVDPRHAKELFDKAFELAPDLRSAFLDNSCKGDPKLRSFVEELLCSLEDANEFLVEPAEREVGGQSQADGLDEVPGTLIDRYKLLQEIGEGGFGTVWMAAQQEPVRRKVALKVIKLGMDTKQVIARFEIERQALALMEHPNIAKVLDAGTTPSGRPFFVMELVNGIPITEYCDKAGLSTSQRLELFQQVCHAVQHAHQKGVIHRDLKPANILVTMHDGRPVPKVIDFGIAKATAAELTQKTLFTEFQQIIGTPEYMAPEQAELSALDIDTRADVYSLGVLLYEMLTGTKPFDSRELLKQGYLEMLRVIREDEPQKPSTRVSTMGEALSVVARRRHATPKSLNRLMRGDLDWIVMMALEKPRDRRYATANDLAADIGRHLLDEPVHASPPSAGYRLRKYIKRHRIGAISGASISIALVVGLGAALWGFVEARDQRDRATKAEGEAIVQRDTAVKALGLAETEKARANKERARAQSKEKMAKAETLRANTVVDLLAGMLQLADPSKSRNKDYTVRQVLDDFDGYLGDKLAKQPDVEAPIRRIMGQTYYSLGLYAKSEQYHRQVLRINLKLYGGNDLQVAITHNDIGVALEALGKPDEAQEQQKKALAILESLSGDHQAGIASVLNNIAASLKAQHKLEKAEEWFLKSIEISRRLKDGNLGNALANLATVLLGQRKYTRAEEVLNEAQVWNLKNLPEGDPQIGYCLMNLATLFANQGKWKKAAMKAQGALDSYGKSLNEEHPAVQETMGILGRALYGQRRFKEAEAMASHGLALARRTLRKGHRLIDNHLQTLALAQIGQGRYAEAEENMRESLLLRRELYPANHANIYSCLIDLERRILMPQGKYVEATFFCKQALDFARHHLARSPEQISTVLMDLASTLVPQRKYEEAEKCLRESLKISLATKPKNNAAAFQAYTELVQKILFPQRRYADAERELQKALVLANAMHSGIHEDIVSTLGNLATAIFDQNRYEEAEDLYRRLLPMLFELRTEEHPDVATTKRNLAMVLCLQKKHKQAVPIFEEALATFRRFFPPGHTQVVGSQRNLAEALEALGQYKQASAICQEILKTHRKLAPAGDPEIASSLIRLGMLLMADKQYARAEPVLRECLDIRKDKMAGSWLTYNAMSALGAAMSGQGNFKLAEPLLLEGYKKMKALEGASNRKLEALERVVALYEAWGRTEDANAWKKRLTAAKVAIENDREAKK